MKTAFEIIEEELLNKHANLGQAIKAAVAAGYSDDEAKEAAKEFAHKYIAPLDDWVY